MNSQEKNYDVGVIVGRFQVAALHSAHKQLIEQVLNSHKRVLIFIGVAVTLGTKNNPLDFTTRLGLFADYLAKYPEKLVIQPLLDVPGNDVLWSRNLDRIIRTNFPLGSICLYGGRGSFVNRYHGFLDTYEFQIMSSDEGSKLRQELGKEVRLSVDFRAGQIYQSQNQYPKVIPTVDIAVIKIEDNCKYVLMGIKESKSHLCFPGGFVDPSDLTLEDAAKRELSEEVNVEISGRMEYIGSYRINDARYTGEERILTTFFYTDYVFGSLSVREEFTSLQWVLVTADVLDNVEESHKVLYIALLNFLERRGR